MDEQSKKMPPTDPREDYLSKLPTGPGFPPTDPLERRKKAWEVYVRHLANEANHKPQLPENRDEAQN